MADVVAILRFAFGAYVVVAIVFLVLENRRPQATLAWILAFFFLPGLGLAAYFLFARSRKAFSRERKLLTQDVEAGAPDLLQPILARQEAELSLLERRGAPDRRLAMLLRRNARSALTRRNDAEILQDAASFYPRLMADIEAARHSVHLQYFIWGADDFTERLKNLLIAKARQGVEVRLLYDPIGSLMHLRPGYLRGLAAAGVRVFPTSPLWRLHTVSYRNHRKITVVDGRIGYVGGMNIGEEHLSGGKGFEAWRDTQLRLAGEAAALLQLVFAVDWRNAGGESLYAPAYFPPAAAETGDAPVQILTSGPDSQWAAIRQLYFAMIAGAQKRIYVQSPFFIPDASIAEALSSAALSGVDVRLMISARASGNPWPAWAAQTYFMEAARAGVRVYLYEKGYLHAKTISVDSEVCSIGSANIDIRSFSINYEINAVLYSAALAQALERAFERDLEDCAAFDPAAYRRRSLPVRLRDSTARLLSPLL